MHERDGGAPGFPDRVCDASLLPGEHNLRVGAIRLPDPPAAANRIVVFGDTGCRMKGDAEQQDCDRAWFFPQIAQHIAAEHPDVIVHVGDYYYRENACTRAAGPACVNPWGDNAASWNADWFAPAAPLFAAAPLVLVRGNHEDCVRGGPGWFHYLEPRTATHCIPETGPYAVALPGLRIVVLDSASLPDDRPDPASLPADRVAFESAAALAPGGAPGDTRWLVTHRPLYVNAGAVAAMGPALAPFDALLAGHTHTFEAVPIAGGPPLIINGEGGDALEDPAAVAALPVRAQHFGFSLRRTPFDVAQYGYAVYTRTNAGWAIALKDRAGLPLAQCLLANRDVTCR